MMSHLSRILTILFILIASTTIARQILIPMDDDQSNHLKSYGIAYWSLERDVEVQWLLNYRGGSFLIEYYEAIEKELLIRGVSYEIIPDAKAASILLEISNPQVNMDAVKLETDNIEHLKIDSSSNLFIGYLEMLSTFTFASGQPVMAQKYFFDAINLRLTQFNKNRFGLSHKDIRNIRLY